MAWFKRASKSSRDTIVALQEEEENPQRVLKPGAMSKSGQLQVSSWPLGPLQIIVGLFKLSDIFVKLLLDAARLT